MIQTTQTPPLTEKAIQTINEIVNRGNTAEIRVRKDKLVVLEVIGKVKCEVAAAE
jgi:hypothetical protein